ncbi:DNA polymerase alpha/primase associated subunit [Ascosphaera apis ARSEF 7405]|uniref:DNA polymerase alpha subunit B n=1 Tax=Ascosphaera apis ARSEF 7405 TaxID=392613 RepID=A0A168AZZ7_9EURO|nr:DNA polymerase alpha/primase associated subunit [Ascosphaera apis ARSEF 7405]
MDNEQELRELFSPANPSALAQDILFELQSIQRLHAISAQELFYKWESYCMKLGAEETRLTLENVRQLKRDIQEALDRESRAKHVVRNQENRRGGATVRSRTANANVDIFGILDDIVPTTPASTKRKSTFQTPRTGKSPRFANDSPMAQGLSSPAVAASSPFAERRDPGQIIESLNTHLPRGNPPIAPYSESRIRPTANTDMKKFGYKPMGMRLSSSSEVLDDRIDEFLDVFQKAHNLDDNEFGSAAQQSTKEIIAVGRIACDSPEGRLNTASLMLETSRRTGAGLRVPLKVDELPHAQFFPGQIVAVRGINPSGEYFTVKEVLEVPLLPPAASTPEVLAGINERVGDEPLNYMIAAGPYTADDNLNFEPLQALCEKAAEQSIDTLILLGPFLDLEHPLIAAGELDMPPMKGLDPDRITMTTFFKYAISTPIIQLAHAIPNITIIMVPSVRDVTSKHVSWPQEMMSRKELGLPKQVRMVSNPVTVSLNEAILGICSLDVLAELRNEEATGGRPAEKNLLTRLPRYLIEQRHFYPLFPGSARTSLPKPGIEGALATGSMLDVNYAKLGDWWNVRPDVLITPSTLPPFVKVIESVLVINPGVLSKRKAPGTYAQIFLHKRELNEEEQSANRVAHEIFSRARVDITRI